MFVPLLHKQVKSARPSFRLMRTLFILKEQFGDDVKTGGARPCN